MIKERRKHKRIVVQKTIRLKLPDLEDKPCGKTYCYSLSEDLSQGGIRIPCEYFIPVKQALNMEIALEDSFGIVNARGEVRWISAISTNNNYQLGIEFVDISSKSRNNLNKFCQLQN